MLEAGENLSLVDERVAAGVPRSWTRPAMTVFSARRQQMG